MFVVLYQWQLKPECLRDFQEGWSEMIQRNIKKYGAIGSKLHKGHDDYWYSYSEWPSKTCWEAAFYIDDTHQEARRKMASAILRTFPPVLMTPILEHLVSG